MGVLKHSNAEWNNNHKQNYRCAQEQCLTCIAALSHSAGPLFDKYYDTFAPILMDIIANATQTELSDVRSRAIECMGCLGESCLHNRTFVNTHSAQLMNGTIAYFKNVSNTKKTFEFDDPFIKTNICLWARILSAIGNDAFEKYLSECVGIAYEIGNISIISNAEFETENKNNEKMAIIETDNGETIAIDSQRIENKLAALQCIDSFLDKYGNKMEIFIDKLFDSLLQSIKTNQYCYDLKIECIKLSLRYISVMIESKSKVLQMSDKLLNVFVAILDEGKFDSNGDSNDVSESQCIGVLAKALLEFLSALDKGLIRAFITEQKLEHIIDSMFLCVLRAQNRIELYSKQESENSFDAIAKLEFVEEKEFEDDLLFNIALILAEFIKIFKDDFLKLLFKNDTANLKKLIHFLNPPKYCSNICRGTAVKWADCPIKQWCLVNGLRSWTFWGRAWTKNRFWCHG